MVSQASTPGTPVLLATCFDLNWAVGEPVGVERICCDVDVYPGAARVMDCAQHDATRWGAVKLWPPEKACAGAPSVRGVRESVTDFGDGP